MNQPRDDQSCQAGKCCGAQEKDGAGCDLAGCAGITDAGDTMIMEQKTSGKIIMFRAFM